MATDVLSEQEARELLMARCRERGLKLTPQRLAVYQAVAGSRAHPSPEAVYRRVRTAMPTMSQATVYKTLDFLEGLGLVSRVANVGETRRYDGNISRHHHLVCTRCNRIIDFHDPRLDALQPGSLPEGFEAEQVSVQVVGTCSDCRRGHATA